MPILQIQLLGDVRPFCNNTRVSSIPACFLLHRDSFRFCQKLISHLAVYPAQTHHTNVRGALPEAGQFLQINAKTVH